MAELKNIAIYGAGGFGREVACTINKINEIEPTWNLIGFFDDGVEKGKMVSHFGPVLGGMQELNACQSKINVIVAIGNPNTVKKVVEKIDNANVEFPNLIYPNTYYSDKESFAIGKGNIIQGGCVFSCDVSIGDFNVFNGSVTLGHDVKIGNFNSFMPAVRISGEVTMGDCNFFGVSSIVLQQLKIKNGVRLAAGSVLMTKPKENSLYIGVPAKREKF